jgi:hypothetical protein
MSDAEGRAKDRSDAGTNAAPIYEGPSRDALEGWRRITPAIVESLDETFEEVIAKQAGRREV